MATGSQIKSYRAVTANGILQSLFQACYTMAESVSMDSI